MSLQLNNKIHYRVFSSSLFNVVPFLGFDWRFELGKESVKGEETGLGNLPGSRQLNVSFLNILKELESDLFSLLIIEKSYGSHVLKLEAFNDMLGEKPYFSLPIIQHLEPIVSFFLLSVEMLFIPFKHTMLPPSFYFFPYRGYHYNLRQVVCQVLKRIFTKND